ncbi:MAG: histidinol dehydrogenase [Gammaproteobacteria bacterium]|nr:histidinol dehydrogenase [Gammaproteobacteria bacterium]NND40372.1 histidinol dehydrogenase [Pseudomonadales bacterium]
MKKPGVAPQSIAPVSIDRLDASSAGFDRQLAELIAWSSVADPALEQSVRDILQAVRSRGDAALLEYTQRFDAHPAGDVNALVVDSAQMRDAFDGLDSSLRDALQVAAARIEDFHQRQRQESWQYRDDSGVLLGQHVTALQRVGIYVPGGKAAYPSSVLMNAIPATVAGVEEIIMVSPAPKGEVNKVVLAAACLAGVQRFYTIGGAQAVAALAYGTEIVPRVDKIVGPGNRFVAAAKKMVFGDVGLDMVAGPSEILVVCDGKTDPDWIAMDMFSQAEHDELAQAILVCPDSSYFERVQASIDRLLPTMERRDIIAASLANRAAFIKVADLEQALEVVNRIAPEHLELSIDNAADALARVKHAGAIFLGRYTPEAFGDYCAGPNHVLPTSTTARFASPLGVYDFQKRSSIISCDASSAARLAPLASTLARAESLTAHARSAEQRGEQRDEAGDSIDTGAPDKS